MKKIVNGLQWRKGLRGNDWISDVKNFFSFREKILSTHFIRKYIYMAKELKPVLSEEASTFISERYTELRSADMGRTDMERVKEIFNFLIKNFLKTMPVTARQLETLIRLSTAIAKSRLAKIIELKDAKKAYELLYFACFKVCFGKDF